MKRISAKTAADPVNRSVCINHSVLSIPTSCRKAERQNILSGLAGGEEKGAFVTGGVYESSKTLRGAVVLFLSVDGSGAAAAAAAFCRFLHKCGGYGKVAVFGPSVESGEDLWRLTETIEEKHSAVALFLDLSDLDRIVIPVINAKAVVFVTDGMRETNRYIARTIHRLPEMTMEPKSFLYAKTGVMYHGFDAEKGEPLGDAFLTALGGFDTEKNAKAAFEKLVMMCTRK